MLMTMPSHESKTRSHRNPIAAGNQSSKYRRAGPPLQASSRFTETGARLTGMNITDEAVM